MADYHICGARPFHRGLNQNEVRSLRDARQYPNGCRHLAVYDHNHLYRDMLAIPNIHQGHAYLPFPRSEPSVGVERPSFQVNHVRAILA